MSYTVEIVVRNKQCYRWHKDKAILKARNGNLSESHYLDEDSDNSTITALDSDNEDEIVVQKPAKKEAAKAAPAVAAAPVKAAAASSAKPVKAAGAPAAPRAPKEGNSAPRAERPPRAAFTGADGEAAKEDSRGGGRGQGRGGKEYRSRGGRGADGAPREGAAEGGEHRPKREYERRSATGRGRGEQSKGGRGAHGFGNVDQEALEAEKDPSSAAPATEEGGDAEVAAEPVVEAEPEPVAMTMDEFLAKRAETRANGAMFGEKKGTRQVESDLSGLQRREDEVLGIYGNFGAVKDSKATHKDQRSTGKTQLLDVSFRNASLENQGRDEERPARGGRGEGRGERGEGRGRGGGRGGGEGRGPRPQASAPRAAGGKLDISDSSAFPSL